MANRRDVGASETGAPEQRTQSAAGSTTSGASAAAGQSGTAAESGGGASGRSEQERQVPVAREAGQRGTAVSRRQGQPSSLVNVPPSLLAGAFMANPFEFMRRMSDEMDRVFSDVFGSSALSTTGTSSRALRGMGRGELWAPQIETLQRGNEFIVRADLPGLDKNDITVEVDNGVLAISGERRQEYEEGGGENENFYRSERSYGSFYRAIPLPDGANENDISANFDNGVLEVTVPTPPQSQQRGRKVEVK